jgi:hypothetical protein
MQVTLTSLNPPKCREVNPYKKPEYNPFTLEATYQFIIDEENFNRAESSLKEWELSEESREKLRHLFLESKPEWIGITPFQEWAIGQTLNVEIVEGKAVIV